MPRYFLFTARKNTSLIAVTVCFEYIINDL